MRLAPEDVDDVRLSLGLEGRQIDRSDLDKVGWTLASDIHIA